MTATHRRHTDEMLGLDYEICGHAPLQALGTVAGREFFFHARNDGWSFEVALENGDLPSDVGADAVFYREGKHKNASYMSIDTGIAIIKRLVTEYIE